MMGRIRDVRSRECHRLSDEQAMYAGTAEYILPIATSKVSGQACECCGATMTVPTTQSRDTLRDNTPCAICAECVQKALVIMAVRLHGLSHHMYSNSGPNAEGHEARMAEHTRRIAASGLSGRKKSNWSGHRAGRA